MSEHMDDIQDDIHDLSTYTREDMMRMLFGDSVGDLLHSKLIKTDIRICV